MVYLPHRGGRRNHLEEDQFLPHFKLTTQTVTLTAKSNISGTGKSNGFSLILGVNGCSSQPNRASQRTSWGRKQSGFAKRDH